VTSLGRGSVFVVFIIQYIFIIPTQLNTALTSQQRSSSSSSNEDNNSCWEMFSLLSLLGISLLIPKSQYY